MHWNQCRTGRQSARCMSADEPDRRRNWQSTKQAQPRTPPYARPHSALAQVSSNFRRRYLVGPCVPCVMFSSREPLAGAWVRTVKHASPACSCRVREHSGIHAHRAPPTLKSQSPVTRSLVFWSSRLEHLDVFPRYSWNRPKSPTGVYRTPLGVGE